MAGIPFHLGPGWFAPWRAAYLRAGQAPREIAGLPLIRERGWLGPLPYRRLRGQTDVHTIRFGSKDATVDADLPERLLSQGATDVVLLDYVPEASPLLAAARAWRDEGRAAIFPFARSPVSDCRGSFADWLGRRSKRDRLRLPKLEAMLTGQMGFSFEVLDGRENLSDLLAEMFAVEASGWKGRAGTAINQDPANLSFYTALAHAAAPAGALRLAVARAGGRIAAFEYALASGGRLFVLKTGFDERFAEHSIGAVLATTHIRRCCADPAINWYDTLGNGLTPPPHKLRLADGTDRLYRIAIYRRGWRGRVVQWHDAARRRAKTWRDRRRGRAVDEGWL